MSHPDDDLPRHLEDERQALEVMMDQTLADSFPASDPPAWGALAARVKQLQQDSGKVTTHPARIE
ncbi:MAG: hypothetical protein ABJC74_15205 [Gemmatimonadota bacterium]